MTKEVLISLFGEYSPVTYMQYVTDPSTGLVDSVEVVAAGAAGVDWAYILGITLFGIVLYSVLRILEAVIRNV